MAGLRWVTNYHPKNTNLESYSYLKECVEGDPKATESYTVEQLKEMGLKGFYMEEKSDGEAERS